MSDTSLEKILIIDDNSDYRKLIKTFISKLLPSVETIEYDPVFDGAPNDDFNWAEIDVLLLDYHLSIVGTTGLDILHKHHKKTSFPATIMLTGAGTEEVAVRALKTGIYEYQPKQSLTKDKLKQSIIHAWEDKKSQRKKQQEITQHNRSFSKEVFYENLENAITRNETERALVLIKPDNIEELEQLIGIIGRDSLVNHIGKNSFEVFKLGACNPNITRTSDTAIAVQIDNPVNQETLEFNMQGLCKHLAKCTFRFSDEKYKFTVSIGLLKLGHIKTTAEQLIQIATAASIKAGEIEGNSYYIWTDTDALPDFSDADIDTKEISISDAEKQINAERESLQLELKTVEEAKNKLEAKLKAAEEANARAEEALNAATEAKEKASAEAEARERDELEAKERAETEARERDELEAKERAETEARERDELEAKLKAEAEAEAKERAELEAKERAETKARERDELEAKERAETEARERAELEAKERAETEARERAELEAKLKAEAEARERAELKAKERAETEARERAEIEAKERAEAEARERAKIETKLKAETEARELAELEAKLKVEAEARELADLEAKEKAEAEAKERAELEAKERAEAEARERAELEAKLKAEAEARARDELEAKEKAEAQARERDELEAKLKAEAEARERDELEAKLKAEAEARERDELEAKLKAEAEARERDELEAKEKAETEARERDELEAKERAEAKLKERDELEAREKAEAEVKERAELEAKLKAEAEAEAEAKECAELEVKEKAEADVKERAELEVKLAIEAKEKMEAELKVITEAKEKAEAEMEVAKEAKEKLEVELKVISENNKSDQISTDSTSDNEKADDKKQNDVETAAPVSTSMEETEEQIKKLIGEKRIIQTYQPVMAMFDDDGDSDIELYKTGLQAIIEEKNELHEMLVDISIFSISLQQIINEWSLRQIFLRITETGKSECKNHFLINVTEAWFSDISLFNWLQKILSQTKKYAPGKSIILNLPIDIFNKHQKRAKPLIDTLQKTYGFRVAISNIESLDTISSDCQITSSKILMLSIDKLQQLTAMLGPDNKTTESDNDEENNEKQNLLQYLKTKGIHIITTGIEDATLLTDAITIGTDYAIGSFIGEVQNSLVEPGTVETFDLT